jgi:hypothetical protein
VTLTPCPTQEQLQVLLAQHLGEAIDTAIENHIEQCDRCQQILEHLTACDSGIRRYAQHPPEPPWG